MSNISILPEIISRQSIWVKERNHKIFTNDQISKRPRIIYNQMTGSSYITLEINDEKEYILRYDFIQNERMLIKKDISTSEYFEF